MNRDILKKAIKKLIIQEITNNQFGIPTEIDKKDPVAEKELTKTLGKDAHVRKSVGTGKTVGIVDNQVVQLSKNSEDSYDVVSVTNESERKIARGVSLETAMKLVKQHAESSGKPYVEKIYDKSLKGFGKKPVKVEEKEKADKMDDVDADTQKEIADDADVKAEEKINKENAPINKNVSAQLGGSIVDKIEKIVDRSLKSKAEPKTAHLKTDKGMESSDKLTTKLKDTPELKEKKK
jgi:hypothetical protein